MELKNTKNVMCLIDLIIAFLTFRLIKNPPGGMVQTCSTEGSVCAQQPVMAVKYPLHFGYFVACNTIAFSASLTIVFLYFTEIPAGYHRFFTWLFRIGMCIAITSFALTYICFCSHHGVTLK